MQVGKNNVSQFLTSNNTCFVIPVYQRNYDWGEDNCRQLWSDLKYVSEEPDNVTHFLGTICCSGTIGREKTIIDGQQRITTLSLIIKAIHDCSDNTEFKEYLTRFLFNTGFGIPESHRIKLRLNTRDDAIYRKLLASDVFTDLTSISEKESESRLYQNYLYFHTRVENMGMDHKIRLINALEKLIIVELEVENEDPQEIFESLNSTGLDLTDVDLLRNFLLMSLDRDTQARLYEKFWYPMEENVGPSNMVRFFQDYYILSKKSDSLMFRGRRTHISAGYIYTAYKEYYRTLTGSNSTRGAIPEITERLLSDMLKWSKIYRNLVFSINTDMNSLDEMERIIYSIVYINESTSARPLLMYILDKLHNGEISNSQATEMLRICLSMVFRSKVTRSTGLNGQSVGNILLRLSEHGGADPVESLWQATTAGRGDYSFPSDEDFVFALTNRPIFEILHSRGTKYLLYSLEQSSPSAKGLPRYDDQNITIEHVMPKTLSKEWKEYLGESAGMHSDYLNKLGNLALTNNNPEMSNNSFRQKQTWYRESSFHYTRALAEKEDWSIDDIIDRGSSLAKKCLELWTLPARYQPAPKPTEPSARKRREPFRFSMIGLSEGDEIEFIDDRNTVAVVADDTHVTYKGELYSLSGLASLLKNRPNTQGPLYFIYNGVTLNELRNEKESNIR